MRSFTFNEDLPPLLNFLRCGTHLMPGHFFIFNYFDVHLNHDLTFSKGY